MESADKSANSGISKDGTTRIIAVVLLITFVASILALFGINYENSHISLANDDKFEFKKSWLELLKNGLILLGTALTTIIGYYFGQREGSIKAQEAQQSLKETDAKAEQAVKNLTIERDNAIKDTVAVNTDSPHQNAPPMREDAEDIIQP
jgi:hypothetical protein